MGRYSQFAYAQARLHARLGQQLSEPDWQHLEGITTLGHFLQRARATSLRGWLFSISQQSDLHSIEQQLRRYLIHEIQTVTRWQPTAWHPSMDWLVTLVELPILQHLLRDDDLAGWLRLDPDYRHLAYERRELRLQALDNSRFAALLAKTDSEHSLWQRWQQQWWQRWPAVSQAQQTQLDQLTPQLIALSNFQAQPIEQASESGFTRLKQTLRLQFRRQTHQPVSAYLYLVLTALELSRLRQVLSRLWFNKQQDAA